MPKNDEREFRLRPSKPQARSERGAWSLAYKIVMHHARMTGRRMHQAVGGGASTRRTRPHNQRCALRVTYSKNATAGQWRAHGRYIARESATREGDTKAVGFDSREESIDITERLESWQKTHDERLWKLIVSPEFGDRIDLKSLTRDLVSRMEAEMDTPLEWVAVAHYNTEHPHVHLAVRCIGAEGRTLRLSRDYIKHGIREVAEDLCTRQLGYRTTLDTVEAQRREVHQHRYTSLDRIIKRGAESAKETATPFFTIGALPERVAERLKVLESMGLAEYAGQGNWRVRDDFENILRAMQRSADRQKMLAAHGVLMSDERLRLTVLDFRQLSSLEGRILVHGEEEDGRQADRSYLMLEGTDGQIHHVYYTSEMEELRSRGGLRTNSFIRLRKLFLKGRPVLEIDELGDSEAILRDNLFLRETAQRLIRRGISPEQDGWNGWLGRYQKAVQEAVILEQQRVVKEAERRRTRDRGR